MDQISTHLDDSAYKIRTALQKKLQNVLKGDSKYEETFS